MDATKISEAIKLIPEKKENLRKAFEALESYSSSLSTFTLQWKDLEDHISSIESSIHDRFNAFHHHQQQAIDSTTTTTMEKNYNNNASNANATPRPELKSLCANMDAKGLRFFISTNREDLLAIRHELPMALRSATDPALLVLDAMDGFHPPNPPPPKTNRRGGGNQEGELQIARRICINLLENLCLISPEIEIKDVVKERALKLAVEWKGQIPGDNALEALGFLQLIASYGLVSEFEVDDVMELFVSVSRRKQAVDLIKSLGFVDMAHELPSTAKKPMIYFLPVLLLFVLLVNNIIQKLSSKGRQLDAVKLVYALNIVDKFPPVPLLKAYIHESKKRANELRKEGNNSLQAQVYVETVDPNSGMLYSKVAFCMMKQNDATAKEMGALKSVLKAVEVHKLGSEYPPEILVKRIAQLEDQKKADKKSAAPISKTRRNQQAKKRTSAASASTSTSRTPQKQQLNKRPRPSPATSTSVTPPSSYNPLLQPPSQLGFAERAPYMGVAGRYGLAAIGSVYSHDAPGLSSALAATGSVCRLGAPSHSSGLAASGSVYNHDGQSVPSTAMVHGGPGISGIAIGQGGIRTSPRPYYPSEYNRPVGNHGYPFAGVPSPYGSSLYP